MARRVSLPAADDLFRRTGDDPAAGKPQASVRAVPDEPESVTAPEPTESAKKRGSRAGSGTTRR